MTRDEANIVQRILKDPLEPQMIKALCSRLLALDAALVKIESGACSKGGEASLVLAMRQIARRALAGEES